LLAYLALVHPRLEELNRSLPERIDHTCELLEPLRPQPPGLPDEHRELGPLLSEPEHSVNHRLRAVPVRLLALERGRDLFGNALASGL
jgi:hypothetical protein